MYPLHSILVESTKLTEALVLASTTEQWRLVVNEALAFGDAVLVSSRCGSSTAWTQSGGNGDTFDPSEDGALSDVVLRVAADPALRQSMGKASAGRIDAWSPSVFAGNLIEFAEAVTASRERAVSRRERPALVDRRCTA